MSFRRAAPAMNATGATAASPAAPAGSGPQLPQGTQFAASAALVTISTGVSSLDEIVGTGGTPGVPLGSLFMVESDRRTGYAQLVADAFAAQGVASEQTVVLVSPGELSTAEWTSPLASADNSTTSQSTWPSVITRLPGWSKQQDKASRPNSGPTPATKSTASSWTPISLTSLSSTESTESTESTSVSPAPQPTAADNDEDDENSEDDDDDMDGPTPFNVELDFSKRIAIKRLRNARIHVVDPLKPDLSSGAEGADDVFARAFGQIIRIVEDNYSALSAPKDSSLAAGGPRRALRIVINQLGSSAWMRFGKQSPVAFQTRVLQFLQALRGLLRSSFAACLVTFPAHLFEPVLAAPPLPAMAAAQGMDPNAFKRARHRTSGFVRRIEHVCDAVVEFESFNGSQRFAEFSVPSSKGTDDIGSASTLNSQQQGLFFLRKPFTLNAARPSAPRGIMANQPAVKSGTSKASDPASSSASAADSLFHRQWGFRLKGRTARRRLIIEPLALPPEGGVSERRVPKSAPESNKAKPKASNKPVRGIVGSISSNELDY
ncbi:hypothetical protein GQ42DRAFT_161014 [Ramicandelaber brevisporus]|nr:hypothetical protein GQ42DRAFT_161014 [Ramicandelaber brevisporus]